MKAAVVVLLSGMTSVVGVNAYAGPAPAGAQNGKVVIDPTLYDLKRVEVLRGPQGTLYGSASMGGTLRLITNQPNPTAFEGFVQSTLSGTDGGGFNHNNSLMVNFPLVQDTLALRVVATENFTSGWIDRIVANPFPLVNTSGSARGDAQAPSISPNRLPTRSLFSASTRITASIVSN